MMPGTPLVTIAAALAWNLLNRTTSATVTDSTIAVTGDVLVSATDGAVLTSTTQAAAIAERDLAVVSSDAVALAALFAANVVRGAVTAAVMGGSVSGADVTIQALAEQAVIDATSQVSAAAGPGTASLSVLPAASLGVAMALNFIGWAVDQTALAVFLATIDLLLGTDFGAEEVWDVSASAVDSTLNATATGASAGNLTVKARSAELVNATLSNVSSAKTAGVAYTFSGAAGAVLATSKVSSRAAAVIESTTPTRVVVQAAGAVAVIADDSAGSYSNVKLTASSITTNDGGMHSYGQVADLLIPSDYWTTDGSATLKFGDRVRIAELGYGQPDFTAATTGTQLQNVTALDNPVTLDNEATVVTLADGYGAPRYTTSSGVRLVAAGDVVTVDAGYERGGNWETSYRYLGAGARLDLGIEDYADPTRWALVGGDAGSTYRYIGGNATLDLNAQDYSDATRWTRIAGNPLSVYEWMGPTTAIADLAAPDLTERHRDPIHRPRLVEADRSERLLPAGLERHHVPVGRHRRCGRVERCAVQR